MTSTPHRAEHRRSSNPVTSQQVPAEEMLRAREAVATYLTQHGVPNHVPIDVRLAVRDAWLEVLRVTPSTAHPRCGTFTIVYQDRTQGGQVFAFHGPTSMIFPAILGTNPEDTTWLHDLADRLDT